MARASKWLKALLQPKDPTDVPLTIKLAANQTAAAFDVQDSAGVSLFSVAGDGAGATKYKTVSISAANITATTAGKLGHADGVVLVADPGTGKVVELVSAIMSYTYAVAAYGAGGNITVNINGGAALTGVISNAASLAAGASNVIQFVPLAATANALTVNKGLNLVAATAFTQPGTAAGTVKVFVAYRVHTL